MADVTIKLSDEQRKWLAGATNGVGNWCFLDWMLSGMVTEKTVIDIRGNKLTLEPRQVNGSVNSCSLHFNLDRAVIREVYAQMQSLGLIRIIPRGRVTTILYMECVLDNPQAVDNVTP